MKLILQNLRMVAAAAMASYLSVPISNFAATANVTVNNLPAGFVPAITNINVGDRVIWTWPAGSFSHNVNSTSTPQAWPTSGLLNGPASFTNTFNAAGSFPYNCTLHGFTGTVNVSAPSVPPIVFITDPANNTVFAEPANVTIQASATDSDGTVTNVQFLLGSTVLANKSLPPFSVVASNLAAGSYTLSAIASDNLGAKATNSVSITVVTPVALTISGAQQSPPANFQFSYAANVGLRYVVQRSTDLTLSNWTALITNTAASNPVTFVDTSATNSPGFYRVGRLPNP